jgi:hypothetical protein
MCHTYALQVYVLQQTEEVLREQDPTGTAPRSDAAHGTKVGHSAPESDSSV